MNMLKEARRLLSIEPLRVFEVPDEPKQGFPMSTPEISNAERHRMQMAEALDGLNIQAESLAQAIELEKQRHTETITDLNARLADNRKTADAALAFVKSLEPAPPDMNAPLTVQDELRAAYPISGVDT